ncbi:hypothetical protein [Leptothermofonsia sp. ETS-13]|uniref:hypothetical protein n=1 Tax=Leptothermofonsia sp. ETS-13 TaxID=3035696 RepID=UPI003BA06942
MANPANYSETELNTLRQAVIMSGHAVVFCEFTVISMGIEIAALGKEIMGAAQNYPNSRLIQKLFANYTETPEDAAEQEPPADITPERILESAQGLIRKALSILSEKASPEEIQEYKQFIYTCADRVANAAGEGLFGTGEKVSKKEAATLRELKATLGL